MFSSITLASMMPYKKNFIITGYYSPLPDQNHYVTGSYYSDKRLNGNGTNGASGAEVFPGMIAAPKSYPFGMKIDIPGIGITEVQDRGGAIVDAGIRTNEYDRLDIWMGAGEDGLRRALLWGKRVVEGTVYGLNPDVGLTATFDDWNSEELSLIKYWKERAVSVYGSVAKLFTYDLWLGQTSEKVTEMQNLLADLGYYFGEQRGTYDDATARAVYSFQRDNDVVFSWDQLGAGHFGPLTRATIEKAKELLEKGEYVNQTAFLTEIQKYDDLKEDFTAYTSELYFGQKGDSVTELQKELIKFGYLRIEPSGYYGETTKNAVMRFQMKTGVIAGPESRGAGVVGPATRTALNQIFDNRIAAKGMIAMKRTELAPVILAFNTDEVIELTEEDNVTVADSQEGSAGADLVEELAEVPIEVVAVEDTPAVLSFGSRGSEVKELQGRLRETGHFNTGFTTDYFGEKTKSALISFQLENQVIASAEDEFAGILDSNTYNLLF